MLDFMKMCEECNPGEAEFLQAVSEVAESVAPVLDKHPEYRKAKILRPRCIDTSDTTGALVFR